MASKNSKTIYQNKTRNWTLPSSPMLSVLWSPGFSHHSNFSHFISKNAGQCSASREAFDDADLQHWPNVRWNYDQRTTDTINRDTNAIKIVIPKLWMRTDCTMTREVYPLLRQIALIRTLPVFSWTSSNFGVFLWCTPTHSSIQQCGHLVTWPDNLSQQTFTS